MGFDRIVAFMLLKYEPGIEDSNQAVEFLIMGPSGYTHRYVPWKKRKEDLTCKICRQERISHANEHDQRLLHYYKEDMIVDNEARRAQE